MRKYVLCFLYNKLYNVLLNSLPPSPPSPPKNQFCLLLRQICIGEGQLFLIKRLNRLQIVRVSIIRCNETNEKRESLGVEVPGLLHNKSSIIGNISSVKCYANSFNLKIIN